MFKAKLNVSNAEEWSNWTYAVKHRQAGSFKDGRTKESIQGYYEVLIDEFGY